jgi:hypothetical protein
MNDAVQRARLSAAVWECDRHRAALAEALAEWQAQPTPSSEAPEQDSVLRRPTDQILYRFTKPQDAMGERLVPATLTWLLTPHNEPQEDWPMRDRLDRLEKPGFLDVETWLAWPDVSNRLAQEDPGAADLRHAAVLAATAAAAAMLGTFESWNARLPGAASEKG